MTNTTGMFRKGHFRCGVLGVQNEFGLQKRKRGLNDEAE